MTVQYWQRSRKPGAKLPPNTICCTRPGWLGNPFYVESNPFFPGQWVVKHTLEEYGWYLAGGFNSKREAVEYAVAAYRTWFNHPDRAEHRERALNTLKNFEYAADWCAPGAPCHVQDVLIPAANALTKKESAHV